jgi:hypothetical protein
MRFGQIGLTLLLFLSVNQAEAGEFRSKVSVGGFIMNRADNLWGRGVEHIDSLSAKPRGVTHAYPLVMVDIAYKNDAGVEFFLGSPPEEPIGMGIGLRKRSDIGTIGAILFLDFFQQGWENPYLLDRRATDVSAFGGSMSWNNIFESNIGISYKVSSHRFDTDSIGALYPDLKQDGSSHRFQLSFRKEAWGLSLAPSMDYERGEFDGASNSYDRYGGGIGISSRIGGLTLMLKGGVHSTRFDKTHPIFLATRDETSYETSLMAIYDSPFGWDRISSTIGYMGRVTDANINFFAAESNVYFATIGYRF